MGEVYRARDSRLNRQVAVKVLPAIFSSDQDRLRRFQQEATAAAALNDPGILAVYDVGTQDSNPYVAILYEMLSGQRAFKGETAADTMSAILKEDPPELAEIAPREISPAVERIVRHCLEKSPEQRFRSAHDVAFALGKC